MRGGTLEVTTLLSAQCYAESHGCRAGPYGMRVLFPLAATIVASCLAIAVWAGVSGARSQPVVTGQLLALAVVEILIFVQVLVGLVMLAGGDRPDSVVTFVGYLVFSLFILPAGAYWAVSERSRWGSLVLVVACLVVPVIVLRLDFVWDSAGA